MKKTRFTETQIVKAIQEHENGRDAKTSAVNWRLQQQPSINGVSDMVALM